MNKTSRRNFDWVKIEGETKKFQPQIGAYVQFLPILNQILVWLSQEHAYAICTSLLKLLTCIWAAKPWLVSFNLLYTCGAPTTEEWMKLIPALWQVSFKVAKGEITVITREFIDSTPE